MGNSFEYVKGNGGLMLDEDYPLGEVQYPCKYNDSKKAVEVEDLVFLPSGDEELLKDAVAAIGPISVGIDGNQDAFYSYGGGIYDDIKCTPYINHAGNHAQTRLISKVHN